MPTARQALPLMRMAKNNPTRIADGDDHAVIGLGYFCQGGGIGPSRNPNKPVVPFWMRKPTGSRWW
jgi:hypothetical protein